MDWYKPGELPTSLRVEPKANSQRGGSSRSAPQNKPANRCGKCGFRIRSEQHENGKHHSSTKRK